MPPTLANMTDAEKYEHQKEVNRQRQKRFYDKHKDKLLQARKDIRALVREPREEVTIDLPTNQTFVEKFESSLSKKTGSSKTKYLNDIKTFINITDCEQLEICLKKPKEILKLIEEATKKSNGELYSVNSKKGFIQSVLVAITELKIKLPTKTTKMYKDYFESLKIKSSDENSKKQQEDKVQEFSKYLDTIKSMYGENSKQYIISKMYDEATIRDDFYLKVVSLVKDATDDKQNYIVVPRSGNLKLIINTYKTEVKYGVMTFTLSSVLSSLIRNYIKTNSIATNDFLFGKAKTLTDYVSKMNKTINTAGGISYFRKMKISEILKDENINDASKRVDLASKMGHSPAIQMRYFRELF